MTPSRSLLFANPFAASVSATSRAGLLGGEHERHLPAEDSLEDRADERVVGAAEDDGVAACVLQRPRVFAHRVHRLPTGLDQGHELRAGDGRHRHTGIERRHERLVAARSDGRLGGEQPDPPVARRMHTRRRPRGR